MLCLKYAPHYLKCLIQNKAWSSLFKKGNQSFYVSYMMLACKNSSNSTQVGREGGQLFSQANMMQFIYFQLVFFVIISDPLECPRHNHTASRALNKRFSIFCQHCSSSASNTRRIYLIKSLHVLRALSNCIFRCFVTVVNRGTCTSTYFISEKVSNSSVGFISTSLSSKKITI